MTTVRCRHLVGTEIAAHVKGVMNLVKRITGMARIIRITRMQTETNTPHLLEEPPSLSKLKKCRDTFAICNFKIRTKTI